MRNITRTAASIFLSVFFFVFVKAQKPGETIREVSPEEAGFSSMRLGRLDGFIQEYVDARQMNGAVGIVIHDGRIVYHKAIGYADIDKKTPMQKDQVFRIASMTKPVISVAVMMLWEEGKFSLDDPVSRFIPEFKNTAVLDKYNPKDTSFTTVPAKREITIRHLLTQTSGIGYAQIGSNFANAIYYKNHINGGIGTPYSTLEEMVPRIARMPLFWQPGEKFQYGMSTDVLGYLVEVVSGMPLDKFLRQRLFSPLGMNDTYFFLPKEKQGRLVKLYMQDGNGKLRVQDSVVHLNGDFITNFPNTPNGTYFSGGAGLSSTAYDYALFCQMLLDGGIYNGARILSANTVRMMTTNQIGDLLLWDNKEETKKFGFGFGIYTEKTEALLPARAGTYEWAGMFASHFWIDPKEKIVAVFMRNVWPTTQWDFGDRVKTLVYQALEN